MIKLLSAYNLKVVGNNDIASCVLLNLFPVVVTLYISLHAGMGLAMYMYLVALNNLWIQSIIFYELNESYLSYLLALFIDSFSVFYLLQIFGN